MKLYYFPVAPNPTRVRIYLAEKGIEVERILVNLRKGEQRDVEHLARNPFGNLPVLELEDGTFLTESLAIMELFEELRPDPPMLGRSPIERARSRALQRIAELGVLAPVAQVVHATRSPIGLPPSPEVAERAGARIPEALGVLDGRLGDRPFLAGDRPTMADCTLYAALAFGRIFDVGLDQKYRNLTRWFAEFGERPSVTGL